MVFRSALGRAPGSRQSALGHARGLGRTGRGTDHWLWERLTALALAPLTIWLIVSLLSGVAADHATLQAWLAAPGNMVLLILATFFFFWHAQIAFGVVIKDYIHHEAWKMGLIIAVTFGCIVFGAFTTVSIVLIGLGG